MPRRRAGLLAAAVLCAGCGPAPVESVQLLAIGTVIEVTVEAPPPGWRAQVRADVEPWLDGWGAQMYAFGDGELAQANARWRDGECVAVSGELDHLIRLAGQLEQRHGDRFVPALADVTRLWRLHDTDASGWRPPDDAQVQAAMQPAPSMRHLVRKDGDAVCATGPIALDVGGFAKGIALNRLARALEDRGLTPALVNIGGDVLAIGQRSHRPWRLGIRHPRDDGALASLAVQPGETVMTSGDYARQVTIDGTRYAHILDPATGRPIQGIASVTVVGRDPVAADAAATALFVAAGRTWAAGRWPDLPAVADAGAFVVVAADESVAVSRDLVGRITWQAPDLVVHERP